MAQRLWKQVQRPEWAKAQAERLDEGHFSQMRSHEEWLKQERQRRWSQEWKQSWAWDWASHRWTWGSGGFGWGGRGWWSQEPTALDSQKMAASSWEEDKDPTAFTTERVHEDMGTHRLKALTPLSFQPQRHITMILGRPVVVLNGPKIEELSNDK